MHPDPRAVVPLSFQRHTYIFNCPLTLLAWALHARHVGRKGINLFQIPRPAIVKCVENRGSVMYLEIPSSRAKKRTFLSKNLGDHIIYIWAMWTWKQETRWHNTCDCNYLVTAVYIFVGVANLKTKHTTHTHTHTIWQNWESPMRTLFITFAF